MQAIHDRPLAAPGLTSYRYKGAYGWIMIGATNHSGALKEALRSLSHGGADMARLQVWDALAGCYVSAEAGGLGDELTSRAAMGLFPLTIAQIEARLNAVGFTLDRSEDCPHLARWMTGEGAGRSYPAVSTGIKHIDSGAGFSNVALPEGARLAELQELRRSGELFAVVRGAILEL